MSLFGSAGRSTSFSFGANPAAGNTTTPAAGNQASTSLFSFGGNTGQSSQQPQQQQAGTSLFGQQQQQPQQQGTNAASGGLFGNNASSGSTSLFGQKPAAGSSLFGQNTQQQQQPASSSLFGNNTQQQQQKPTFSFGAPQQSNTQPQQQTSLFGSTGAQQQPQQQSSLFGSAAQQPQQQQQQQQNGMSAAGFGASSSAQSINPSSPFAQQPFHQKERFNDLPENAKKLFTDLDTFINGQLRIKDELASRDYGSDIRKRAAEWSDLHGALGNTHVILQQDTEMIKSIVDKVEHDRTDFVTMLEIAQNYKENKGDGKQWASWPGEYFSNAASEFRERIVRYRSTIDAIEKQLSTIDSSHEHSPQLIADAIQNQHAVFMALASQVAGMHSEVDQLRREYTQWYQQQYRSVQDPFAMSQMTLNL